MTRLLTADPEILESDQGDLPVGLLSENPVQSYRQKYFAGAVGQIRGTGSRVLSHRGALANVINAGRDADGEVVWS